MLEFAIIAILLAVVIAVFTGLFYIISLVIERFILVTLPILANLYGRIKYPKDFAD
jgi:hypothetical protein